MDAFNDQGEGIEETELTDSDHASSWQMAVEDSWEEPDAYIGGAVDDSDQNFSIVGSLPSQLHPAVSRGMRRVSSCYFSIQSNTSEASTSVADLLSLLEESTMMEESNKAKGQTGETENGEASSDENSVKWSASDVLYHDIMMHVFTFLDGPALTAFSETGRRPNFECFYFLQLQLQRAMLADPSKHDLPASFDSLDAIAGVGSLSRLAVMDEQAAKAIVKKYEDSNSTLRMMPLSHSLAYIRQVLRRNGFHAPDGSQPNKALASAAILITLVGAASYMGGSTEAYVNALPNTLFKVGLAGGLMGAGVTARDAARKMSDADDDHHPHRSMRHTAEQMARMMSELPSQLLLQLQPDNASRQEPTAFSSSMTARMFRFSNPTPSVDTGSSASQVHSCGDDKPRRGQRSHKGDIIREEAIISKIDEGKLAETEAGSPLQPLTPNPYEHLSVGSQEQGANSPGPLGEKSESSPSADSRKMPSGCVGAYSRAVRNAASKVTELIKEQRKSNYNALSENEQLTLSRSFIDACASDDTLDQVKKRVQTLDVDSFYVGSDGTEICALHTASFHGACRVIEFLCQGIDETSTEKDGGLGNVNLKDANGWTALHFAAGANCVEAVQILARNGAQLAVEAANGYTPFHWAQRLSNNEVAEELQRLGADQRFLEMNWIRTQPLSVIASRFFSMIPTH